MPHATKSALQDAREAFIAGLARRADALRPLVENFIADPSARVVRAELQRRLHALLASAQLFEEPVLVELLQRLTSRLDAVGLASEAWQTPDSDLLLQLLATLDPRTQVSGQRSGVPPAVFGRVSEPVLRTARDGSSRAPAPANETSVRPRNEHRPPPAPPPVVPTHQVGAVMLERVLLVCSRPHAAELRSVLDEAPLELLHAADPEQALTLVERCSPSYALVAAEFATLPDIDLVGRLRQHARHPVDGVYLMLPNGATYDADFVRQTGADGVLIEPISWEMLGPLLDRPGFDADDATEPDERLSLDGGLSEAFAQARSAADYSHRHVIESGRVPKAKPADEAAASVLAHVQAASTQAVDSRAPAAPSGAFDSRSPAAPSGAFESRAPAAPSGAVETAALAAPDSAFESHAPTAPSGALELLAHSASGYEAPSHADVGGAVESPAQVAADGAVEPRAQAASSYDVEAPSHTAAGGAVGSSAHAAASGAVEPRAQAAPRSGVEASSHAAAGSAVESRAPAAPSGAVEARTAIAPPAGVETRASVAAGSVAAPQPTAAILPSEKPGERPRTLIGRRILVVDDDLAMLWFFSGVVRDAGGEALQSRDGVDGLDTARRKRPQVVLSDILMPKLDGFGLRRALARDLWLERTPVLLLSWKGDPADNEARTPNASGLLQKTASVPDVLAAIERALAPRKRIEDALRSEGPVTGDVGELGIVALIECVVSARPDVRLTVEDDADVFDVDVVDANQIAVTRTAADGTFTRAERALMQLIGVTQGRFQVRQRSGGLRSPVQTPLKSALHAAVSEISAMIDAVTSERVDQVARLSLDDELLASRLKDGSGFGPMIAALQRLGMSPKQLLLEGTFSSGQLSACLMLLARQAVITGLWGSDEQDLLAKSTRLFMPRPVPSLLPAAAASPTRGITTPAPISKAPAPVVATPAPAAMEVAAAPPSAADTPSLRAESVSSAGTPSARVESVASASAPAAAGSVSSAGTPSTHDEGVPSADTPSTAAESVSSAPASTAVGSVSSAPAAIAVGSVSTAPVATTVESVAAAAMPGTAAESVAAAAATGTTAESVAAASALGTAAESVSSAPASTVVGSISTAPASTAVESVSAAPAPGATVESVAAASALGSAGETSSVAEEERPTVAEPTPGETAAAKAPEPVVLPPAANESEPASVTPVEALAPPADDEQETTFESDPEAAFAQEANPELAAEIAHARRRRRDALLLTATLAASAVLGYVGALQLETHPTLFGSTQPVGTRGLEEQLMAAAPSSETSVRSGLDPSFGLGTVLPYIDTTRGVPVGNDEGLVIFEYVGPLPTPNVEIDGRVLGSPPLSVALAATPHQLKLWVAGEPTLRTLSVRAGETRVITLPLLKP